MLRYRSVRPDREPLRRRPRELATVRVRAGYETLHLLLRREGWKINHKLTYRLYCEEALTLKRRRTKRRTALVVRAVRPIPTTANSQWAMDFMHDRLSDGRSLRALTVIDIATRECIALKAATRFQGSDVAEVLRGAKTERGALPQRIRVDNGTEFTSKALDHWAYWNQIQLDFSRPGKPTDNAFIEAFNGAVRRECLSAHWFTSVADANQILSAWRDNNNNARPHSSLGGDPPALYRAGATGIADRKRLGESRC
jgi:putative transposase